MTVSALNITNLQWLGGAGYNLAHITFGVTYKDEPMTMSVVMWENAIDPIITGREELGFQKLFMTQPPTWREGDAFGFHLERGGETVFRGRGQTPMALDPNAINEKNERGPDTCILRCLPLESHVELIRSRTNAMNGLNLYDVHAGQGQVSFLAQQTADGSQPELLQWLAAVELFDASAPVNCVYGRGNGVARFLDQVVMERLPKEDFATLPLLTRFTGSQQRIPLESPVSTRRIVIRCEADATRLRTLFPMASSRVVDLTVSSYSLMGRPMMTLRLTTPVSGGGASGDGHLVMAQFDHDPDMVYISREQLGAPSFTASIDVAGDAVTATWRNLDDGTPGDSLSFEFLTVRLRPPAPGAAQEAPEGATHLLHDYVMTAPGNAAQSGGSVGLWHVPTPGKRLIGLDETVSNIEGLAPKDASLAFKPCDRRSSPTGHMLFTNLASLGLMPVGASVYTADVAISLDPSA